jgi:hypothetical protein
MTSIFKFAKFAIAAVLTIDARCGIAHEVKRDIEDDGDAVESLRGRGQRKKRQLVDDDGKTVGVGDAPPPFDYNGFDAASTTTKELVDRRVVERQPDAGILDIKTSTNMNRTCIATDASDCEPTRYNCCDQGK